MSKIEIVTDNINVIREWKDGKNARNFSSSLSACDGILWSLHRKIGHRTEAGVCVIADLTLDNFSPGNYDAETTLCHIKLAKPFADTIFHQLVSESSPLFIDELPF